MNDLIYILILVIILFVILHFIYNSNNVSNNNTNVNTMISKPKPTSGDTNTNATIKTILTIAQNNATAKLDAKLNGTLNEKLKEKFEIDPRFILEKDAISYSQNLSGTIKEIDINYYSKFGILNNFKTILANANKNRKAEINRIINYLTNIYMNIYLDQIYKKNAEMYKVNLKYSNPKTNKYYSQYIL